MPPEAEDPVTTAKRRAATTVSIILFCIAGFYLVVAVVLWALMPGVGAKADAKRAMVIPEFFEMLVAFTAAVGLVFAVLGCWARAEPLAPALIALVLTLLATAVNLIMRPDLVFSGQTGANIALLVLLGYAVKIASDYHQVKREEPED